MIEAQVLFFSNHFDSPKDVRASEYQNALMVDGWIKRVVNSNPEMKIPMLLLTGPDAISDTEYIKFRDTFRSLAFPCPIMFALSNPQRSQVKNSNSVMWVEDERGLPDEKQQVLNILEYIKMTNMYRLPI